MKKAMTASERQAAYRTRKGTQVNLLLPLDVKAGLDAYIERHGSTISDTITQLLRAQLLRKR